MKRLIAQFAVLAVMLTGLPMLGVVLAGRPAARYLEFPPETRYVRHAPFSAAAFVAYALFVAAAVIPFAARWLRTPRARKSPRPEPPRFPWWGWAGAAGGAVAWSLAWTRFSWFAWAQPHTFMPLWLAYIVVVNALTVRAGGRCMITHRTGLFLSLFPVSAAFWWFFEYLNRFVQNWFYTGVHYGPWAYAALATLSFSTVLPAVAGTRDLLMTSGRLHRAFVLARPLRPPDPRTTAWAALAVSTLGLGCVGIWPDLLFPLLWVSPLLIAVSLQSLCGRPHVFSGVVAGDWRAVVSAALSALVCGFFWEMWNALSLARWSYAVPLVHRAQVFEMPLLGYAGYLPFGLTCAAVVEALERVGSDARH